LEVLAHFHESIHIRLRFNTSLLLSSADFLHQFYITTLHIMNGAYHKSTRSYSFGHKLCWIIGVQIGTHSPSKLDSEDWSKFYLLASRNTKWPKIISVIYGWVLKHVSSNGRLFFIISILFVGLRCKWILWILQHTKKNPFFLISGVLS
jgi:hypothetical protein